MAIELVTKVNVDPATGAWPFGMTKNNTGSGNGTPLDNNTMSDYFQFFAKMFYESGLTYNGLVDNATNTFQYYNALKVVINQYKEVNSYNVNTSLVDADFGKFSIMDAGTDADFTLPALSGLTTKQEIVLMKVNPGVCQVIPNGSDVIVPSGDIYLRDGDCILLVSFGFGWLIKNISRKNILPRVDHTAATFSLLERHLGCINAVNCATNTTYTLPPASATNDSKKIKVLNVSTTKFLTLVAAGADTVFPSQAIFIRPGGYVELMSAGGNSYIIVDSNIDDILIQSSTQNGLGIEVEISASAPFAYNNDTYKYSYFIKNGFCYLNFKVQFDVTDGAYLESVYIPLPNGIEKDITITEDFAARGFGKFEAPTATSNYGSISVSSIRRTGVETQSLELKRNEGTTTIIWETGITVTLRGQIIFKLKQ